MPMQDPRKEVQTIWSIQKMTENQGYPPTVREIAGFMGLSQTAVAERIATLKKDGYLVNEYGKSRTLKVTEKGLRRISR